MASKALKAVAKAETVEQVIDAMDKRTEHNMRVWNALSKTDPEQTKGFKRAGGFSGTAVKPIWIVKRLTEQFGPCGEGWGIGEPRFDLVNAQNGDALVYCTVSCWHGSPENVLFGVGGDKAAGTNKYGPYTDDEAFKKAFTDAVNNAFKFVGVAADIHMGLFDDSKYLAEVRAEFHPPAPPKAQNDERLPEDKGRSEGEMSSSALRGSLRMLVHHINGCGTTAELEDLLDTADAKEVIDNCQRRFPAWWETGENMPSEFVPLKKLIEQTRKGLADLEKEPA